MKIRSSVVNRAKESGAALFSGFTGEKCENFMKIDTIADLNCTFNILPLTFEPDYSKDRQVGIIFE